MTTNPPRFTTTRTQSGQRYTLATNGAVARGGGSLAPIQPGSLEHPPGIDEATHEYDPGDLKEIDKAIRHLPGVVAYCRKKAQEMVEMASDNFEVIVSDNPANTRARAYGAPANGKGIHEELSDHVLLKAAINMAGK